MSHRVRRTIEMETRAVELYLLLEARRGPRQLRLQGSALHFLDSVKSEDTT